MALTARLYDAQGSLVTNGLLDKFVSFRYSERLDEIGSFDLRLPLAYARSKKYIDAATTIAVSEDFTEFFRGTIDRAERNGAEYAVTGSDLLAELRYPEAGASYTVNGDFVADVVDALLLLTENSWTANTSTQSLRVVADFNGKQVFDALRELMATYGLHMRRLFPSMRSLQIAAFGTDTGYTLTNAPTLSEAANSRNMASIIDAPQTTIDRSQIVNRVIAFGGTYSSTPLKLPLSNRTGTSTVIHSRTRGDSTEHYIENAASQTLYGIREKVVRFSEIIPASSATADVERAEDFLLTRAEGFLSRWATPVTNHRITCKNFNRIACRLGDLARLRYEETVSDDTFISIDDTFYLTEVSGSFNTSGQVTYDLTLTDSNRVKLDDREALAAVFKQLEDLKNEDLT